MPIDAHQGDETEQQDYVPGTQRRDRAIRKLFELGPHVSGFPDEAMRVLKLNRQRPRGHAGRIFMGRDIRTRREMQRSKIERSSSRTSSTGAGDSAS